MSSKPNKLSYRERKKQNKPENCYCCSKSKSFYWQCRCGFSICQDCMQDNLWGMTCNKITWVCPDCGQSNGFGNQ